MTKEEVIRAISAGVVDEDFDAVYEALKLRNKFIGTRKALSFAPEDKVVFNDQARPRYLIGVEGVVTKLQGMSIIVRMPKNITGDTGGRFEGFDVTVPPQIIDKVDV